eukprot:GFUD01013425.1.p1 GENE.GFUD01013425.1~~GFUD01013425.1.p1  ORF type:complete len:1079 (+),score=254.39 GFUD01013425.1:143-3379(+)
MGDEQGQVNMEPLLPTSPTKKVKSARFQVAQVGDKNKKGEDDNVVADENGWTHQGSMRSGGDTVQFTQYAKSFRHYLTREALPAESNYRNLLSFGRNSVKGQRPTLEQLREEEIKQSGKAEKSSEEDLENQKKGKVIKFGWIEGVYMRCLLNIWGVMLFLRLTWVMGQCGIVQGLLVMTFCNVVTTITAISMSAVSTNGQIKGGGVYFMISRALGPEFGGAIGLMFTLANSIAVSMYIIGFAESFLDMFQDYVPGWQGIVDPDFKKFRTNDVRIIGSVTLVGILVLAIVGMDWVTRVQKALLVLLMCSQVDFIIGTFLPRAPEVYAKGFTGWSIETAKSNLGANYEEGQSFFSVFAVFFPAVTGIVAGANLSGDLKDPAVAIPKGTLSAIVTTYITYIIYGTMVSFTYLTAASGSVEEYEMWTNSSLDDSDRTLPSYLDCTAGSREGQKCEYGTLHDQQTMAVISCTGYLIYGGCFAATISSAIASLVGAPRVLQALAKDKLYPKIEFFAPGWGANNDPVRGYVLVFFIALACILVAELNLVSSLLSNFFVAAYALINFSVFHASITKSPGWRPAFKFYNPWVALFGVILCVFSMFAMDWVTALITFLITAVLYLYIYYRKPEANWGSSAQAQVFVNALKGVQSLTDTAEHVKNYRPKVLVLTGNPAHRPPLVDFANLITKKLSLLICSHVITEPGSVHLATLKESTQTWLTDKKIKGFYTVTESNKFEEGAKSCLTLAGLGKLAPNMLLVGFKADWTNDLDVAKQYFSVLQEAFDLAFSVGILRVRSGLDFSGHIQAEETESNEFAEEERRGSFVGAMGEPIEGEEVKDVKALEGETDSNNERKGSEPSDEGADVVPEVPKFLQRQRTRTRTISRSVYHDSEGNPVSKDIISDMNQFQSTKRSGNIDVWWLYDDGGLTLLLPYILTTRQQFSDCKLRVFTLANRKDELDRETRNMAALLAKFRIEFSSVVVIPDVTKRASDASRARLDILMAKLPEGSITEEELLANKEKTNRHLRLSELLQGHSKDSEIIFMTLPMPRKGHVSAPLYLAWLDVMTENLPPTLLIRGNQTSVLTFYS